jgi:adenosylcobinamide-GDP ribazoletransferase
MSVQSPAREFGYLRSALGLLSTLPMGRTPAAWRPGDSGRAAHWYPVVGLVIGGLTWLTWRVTFFYFPAAVAGVLSLLIWVALSGGLHLDGLADCCDGLFAPTTPAKRLEIMKDPRLGTFGGVGLLIVLLLKAAALSTLPLSAGPGILLAAVVSRWCILPAGKLPLARPGGMGTDFSSGLRRGSILIGALLPLGVMIALGRPGVVATLAALLAAGWVCGLAKSRLGGVTGDVFGMLVEVTETVILLVFTFGAP